jgi:divalent metal cation (Fe/Co/Zn/Cd) transporter
MPLAQAHTVAHDVQRKIKASVPGVHDVVVHVEPQPGESGPQSNDVLDRVREVAHGLGIPVHHLNAHEIGGLYSVNLHLEVPDRLTLGQAHAQANLLEDRVKSQVPEVSDVNTHIEPRALTQIEPQETIADSVSEQRVQELTQSIPGVHNCHHVCVRRIGESLFLTLHCTLDEQLPVSQAHEIATDVEERVRSAFPDVMGVSVHVEPSQTDPLS